MAYYMASNLHGRLNRTNNKIIIVTIIIKDGTEGNKSKEEEEEKSKKHLLYRTRKSYSVYFLFLQI